MIINPSCPEVRAGVWGSAGRRSGGLPCEGSPCCSFWFTMPWCWSAGGCGGTPPNFGVEPSLGKACFHLPLPLLYSHPHPCLSGYWYRHVFVNPQGERNPRVVAAVRWLSLRRPVKSKVQVAAAVVTCPVGIPCSSAYAAVLADLPPCLAPLAALAALPRWVLAALAGLLWAVSQNKSLLQRLSCECSCVRWVSLLHWLLLSQVSQIESLLPWLSCTCRLVSLLCLLLCWLTSCHVCLLLCWLTCTTVGWVSQFVALLLCQSVSLLLSHARCPCCAGCCCAGWPPAMFAGRPCSNAAQNSSR